MNVQIQNTTKADISLVNAQHEAITVPAARENPDDRRATINGVAITTPDFLETLKENAVVVHYFDSGMLKISEIEEVDDGKEADADLAKKQQQPKRR